LEDAISSVQQERDTGTARTPQGEPFSAAEYDRAMTATRNKDGIFQIPITGRKFQGFDPTRPAGISSTDKKADARANAGLEQYYRAEQRSFNAWNRLHPDRQVRNMDEFRGVQRALSAMKPADRINALRAATEKKGKTITQIREEAKARRAGGIEADSEAEAARLERQSAAGMQRFSERVSPLIQEDGSVSAEDLRKAAKDSAVSDFGLRYDDEIAAMSNRLVGLFGKEKGDRPFVPKYFERRYYTAPQNIAVPSAPLAPTAPGGEPQGTLVQQPLSLGALPQPTREEIDELIRRGRTPEQIQQLIARLR
jgi:hypothetical protein